MNFTDGTIDHSVDYDVNLRRELVSRVVTSSTFSKSKRLSSLLLYVCDQALAGETANLNEQKIGEAVFNRPKNYDSSIDGIVRTQASRLRQRLELYFAEEGADEPVRIFIPRGGYIPLFEPRESLGNRLPQESVEPGLTIPSAPSTKPRWVWLSVFAWVLVLILAIALAISHFRSQHVQAKSTPMSTTVEALWSQMFISGVPTLFIPADSGLVLWEGLTKQSVGLSGYVKGDFRSEAQIGKMPKDLLAIADGLSRRRYTTVVDLEAYQALSRIAESEKGILTMRYTRDVMPDDLKNQNVILVGAPESNPWVHLFEPQFNFVFEDSVADRVSCIRNRAPRKGEPAKWTMASGDLYGVVAFVHGLNEQGNALVIGGTTMAGTEAALDFLSDNAQLEPFLDRIRRSNGTIPHFEVVVGTSLIGQNATKTSVLAWRILN